MTYDFGRMKWRVWKQTYQLLVLKIPQLDELTKISEWTKKSDGSKSFWKSYFKSKFNSDFCQKILKLNELIKTLESTEKLNGSKSFWNSYFKMPLGLFRWGLYNL